MRNAIARNGPKRGNNLKTFKRKVFIFSECLKSVYVAMTIFHPGRIKRTRNLLFAYVGVHISCKMMHMTQSGLETNSSGDVV